MLINEIHASTVKQWMSERGGIDVWGCLDLSDPGKTWTTPRGAGKPHYAATSEPIRQITDPGDIQVIRMQEVRRIKIATRVGAQGFKIKLTDASSRRLDKALDAAGDGASYRFDFETREAVILAPAGDPVPLDRWEEFTQVKP